MKLQWEHSSCGEWLREMGWFILEKRRFRAEPHCALQLLKGGWSEGWPLPPGNCNRLRGNGLILHPGKVRLGIKEKEFSEREVMKCPAAQGGDVVTIPGGVQES